MEYFELLSLLCQTMSVSGQEERAKDTLRTHLAPLFDEYRCDTRGNHCFVRRGSMASDRRLVIDAHFDEIGMMVKEITAQGFLKVCGVGGLDARTLQASRVTIYADEILHGVLSSTPPHLSAGGDSLAKIDDLFVDTGLSCAQLTEKGVHIGTPIAFATEVHHLQNGRICGHALDNKACCAAALMAAASARIPANWDVFVLLSAKEEIGGGGAKTAAADLRPDIALILDGNIGAVSSARTSETVVLGKGVSVSLSCTTDRILTEQILALAKEASIPHQRIAEATSTGTNADLVTLAENGIRTAVLSLPLRHMHTPSESIAMQDVEAMLSLLRLFIERGLDA